MKATAPRPATYEELRALPDDVLGQLVDGELWATPRPAIPHQLAGSSLVTELGPFGRGRGPGGWWILYEPELHLGPDVLVPDLAGWRTSRMPSPPAAPYVTLPPDWVCEILSPSTAALDRVRKLAVYAREGVAHVWLADPAARTLEVLERQTGHWLLVATHGGDVKVRAPPFDAIELDLANLWMPPAEGTPAPES